MLARGSSKVLSRTEIPTVVFCGNDLIAMGAMSALEESGVQVPKMSLSSELTIFSLRSWRGLP